MTPVGCDAGPMHVCSKHMAVDIRRQYAAKGMLARARAPARAEPLVGQ